MISASMAQEAPACVSENESIKGFGWREHGQGKHRDGSTERSFAHRTLGSSRYIVVVCRLRLRIQLEWFF